MRKYLLPSTGKFFKANLHCHSTCSDGAWTPEQIKENYQAQGYSVVAYTDHDRMIRHNELTDDSFLAMNGYELGIVEPPNPGYTKVCHICYVALSPDIQKDNCYDFVSEYTHSCISSVMKKGREEGYFVTYNHPTWSLQNYSDYMGYEGMHAMEIHNYACYVEGFEEFNSRVYDDMLRGGKRIYCIATDDNHNGQGDEGSFGGFTMIKAEKLDYPHIADALVKGHFYASEGPQIHALWIEDDKIRVECSEAVHVYLTSGVIYGQTRKGTAEQPITSAEFTLKKDHRYFRVVVRDKEGRRAYTNAYFMDEL